MQILRIDDVRRRVPAEGAAVVFPGCVFGGVDGHRRICGGEDEAHLRHTQLPAEGAAGAGGDGAEPTEGRGDVHDQGGAAVSPDEEGDIVSLELKFNEKENAEIKHLIQVVFKHIKELNLPDTSAALTSSNPTKAFYDQLIAE